MLVMCSIVRKIQLLRSRTNIPQQRYANCINFTCLTNGPYGTHGTTFIPFFNFLAERDWLWILQNEWKTLKIFPLYYMHLQPHNSVLSISKWLIVLLKTCYINHYSYSHSLKIQSQRVIHTHSMGAVRKSECLFNLTLDCKELYFDNHV